MSDDLLIYEKLSSNPIKFESKEEFMRYYTKNKEAVDQMKTRGMNRKFIIDGYKIGRQLGKLILYPNKTENNEVETNEDDLLQLKLDSISERLKKLESLMNQMVKLLNSMDL